MDSEYSISITRTKTPCASASLRLCVKRLNHLGCVSIPASKMQRENKKRVARCMLHTMTTKPYCLGGIGNSKQQNMQQKHFIYKRKRAKKRHVLVSALGV